MKRILVIEDDPLSAELFHVILLQRGYEVVIAQDAESAMKPIDQGESIDLVLLDIRLPGLPGPELKKALNERRPNLPVIYVSGSVDEHPNGGQTPMVNKPFKIKDLLDAVRAQIGDP